MPFDEPVECPLCMEPLDIDDMNFYPCTCGYQICRFCWHRIRTDENSLCPACRKQYQEDPAEFKPLTDEELTSIKKERRQKDMARKQKAAENRRHLANIRVVQKNLVFVVGLSNRLADTEVLKRQEYFGKYGKILKVVINSSTSYAGAQGPSASAYITYTKPEDCLRAIQAVNNLYVDGRTLKASLGTTKYCSHFLKGTQCGKADCMYLHELGEEEASFTKDEMQAGKHQDYELRLNEQYLAMPNLCPAATSSTTTSSKPVVNGQSSNVELPVSIAATGSSTAKITAASRKKTDSGSSAGSSKAKEPWPLLNKTVSNGETVINSTELSSSPLPDDMLSSSDHLALLDSDENRQQMLGRSCSPQSSSCSTTSNPRTPTPDTVSSSHSPRITENTTAIGTDTLSTLTSVSASTEATNPALPTHPPTARRLPFTDSSAPGSYLPAPDHSSFFPNSKDASLDIRLSNTDSLQFTGLSKEVNATSQVSNPMANWHAASNQPLMSDDDLGFDPFLESNKGLADMLENENGYTSHMIPNYRSPLVRQPPPGVPAPPHLSHPGLFSDGMMSSVMSPLMPVVSSSSSPLPPPPPGLSSFPQFPNSPVPPNSADPAALRGSRMLNLLNLNHTSQQASSVAPGMMPSSPVHNMPSRNMYTDARMSHHMPQPHNSFNGMPNGMSDIGSFSTQDLRESLKALLPNASINFAPGISNQQQPLQQSRLRNNYMQNDSHTLNHSMSWNGSSTADDQFSDPAIVSGCLSGERSASPPGSHPHWMKSIQQLAEVNPVVPVNQHLPSQAHQQHQTPNAFRPPATHSRMPFAQNINMSQNRSSSGWPALTAHNPPPGFQSSFRPATAQNPRMATLES